MVGELDGVGDDDDDGRRESRAKFDAHGERMPIRRDSIAGFEWVRQRRKNGAQVCGGVRSATGANTAIARTRPVRKTRPQQGWLINNARRGAGQRRRATPSTDRSVDGPV